MDKVHIMNHPLIMHKLTIMRDKNTTCKDFRKLVYEVALLMGYESTKDLPIKDQDVETPIAKCVGKVITKQVALIPILRAGLGMVDAIMDLIPASKIGHIGLYRDHKTLQPIEYYFKAPADIEDRIVIVLDPMLATGGSAIAAIDALKKRNVNKIKFMCMIAAPEGLNALKEAHPDIEIYVGALDEKLNENGYIIPGLGDAGDRIFGTI